MTQPAKPWQEMSAAEKRDAVKQLIIAGTGYSKIADMLGAPSRHCVAGVVSRLREMGALPQAPSRQTTGSMSGTIARVKSRARQAKKANAPRPSSPVPRQQSRPQRQPTAKLIALPGAAPRQVSSMVDAYIAANGVRRFERGMSNDLDALRAYAGRHGYEIDYSQRNKPPYTIRSSRGGRPRQVDRDGLFAFVDDLRVADGKEPFLLRKDVANGPGH